MPNAPTNLRRQAGKIRKNWRLTLPDLPKLSDMDAVARYKVPGLLRYEQAMEEWKRSAEENIRAAMEQMVGATEDTAPQD